MDAEKEREYNFNSSFVNSGFYDQVAPNKSLPDSPEPIYDQQTNGYSNKGFGNHNFESTPENEKRVLDLKEELNNWIDKYNQLNNQLLELREKMELKSREMQSDLEIVHQQLNECESENALKQNELQATQR